MKSVTIALPDDLARWLRVRNSNSPWLLASRGEDIRMDQCG